MTALPPRSKTICLRTALALLALLLAGTGCRTSHRPGSPAARSGDEIVAAGQFIHTGTPVVLWMDPGGYDAYRVERRFSPLAESDWDATKAKTRDLTTPNRYGMRHGALTEAEVERARGGGWDLPLLQRVVDQFVIHFDACGTSRQCFKVLQDVRGLSVHFLLDLDGTIYQTLDLKERAWHATSANSRAVGIEIANIGAYRPGGRSPLNEWYHEQTNAPTRLTVPARFAEGAPRSPGFSGHPARPQRITGQIQGGDLMQYDFTPEQYAALAKLTAALCQTFPRLKCDYPRDPDGRLVTRALSEEELTRYQGLLGHFHIQTNKVDPGPAFQWDLLVNEAQQWMAPLRPPSSKP